MTAFPDPWRAVFEKWLRERPCLDRIEYCNVGKRRPGKTDYTGPIVVLTQEQIVNQG